MPRSSSRISKMWRVDWRDTDGREHYREVWSQSEGRTLLRKKTEAKAIPIGEPTQLANRWGVRWRDARGRGHKRVLSSLRAAKDLLIEEDGKRKRGEATNPKDARQTLAEVFKKQTATKPYAQASLELRRAIWTKYVGPELGDTPIGKIDTARIDALLAGIARPVMRNKTRGLLALLFGHAVRKHWLTASPVSKPERGGTRAERIEQGSGSTKDRKRKRYLNEKQLAVLLAEIPERWRAMVELMARVGLRPGEAYVLRVGKFTAATEVPERKPATLLIDTSLSGWTKTGEPRTVTLPTVLAEKLAKHIEEFSKKFSNAEDPEAPMFPKEDGSMIDSKNAADAWRRRTFAPAASRAGLGEKFVVNNLRHSAVSFAIDHGATIYDVQNMVGHAKPSITLDVYGERWDSSAGRLAERLDKAIRKTAAPESGTVSEIGGRA